MTRLNLSINTIKNSGSVLYLLFSDSSNIDSLDQLETIWEPFVTHIDLGFNFL